MKIKNRYKFKITDNKTQESKEMENMSFKRMLKSVLVTSPKFNGTIHYTNKKGNDVCHSIIEGKKIWL